MIILNVEVSGNCGLEQAAGRATGIARKLGCHIRFVYNGITLVADPDVDSSVLVTQYETQLASRTTAGRFTAAKRATEA